MLNVENDIFQFTRAVCLWLFSIGAILPKCQAALIFFIFVFPKDIQRNGYEQVRRTVFHSNIAHEPLGPKKS